jgi:hypothetical protein
MLRKDRPEASAANHNNVERTSVVLGATVRALAVRVSAAECFIHSIADVAAENVSSEIGFLSLFSCHHFTFPNG